MSITSRTVQAGVLASALIGSLAFAGTAFAESKNALERNMPRPTIVGIVTSVASTTLTISSKGGERDERAGTSTLAVYTVNAANATVTKDGVVSSLGAVAVGDKVMVRGTLSGTTITAASISEGKAKGREKGELKENKKSQTPPFMQGTGEPVIGGNVTAVGSTTLTLTTKTGTVYTVDVSSSTISRMGTTSALANIATGDAVIVQGTVTGTSVKATSVIDRGTVPTPAVQSGEKRGFFKSIGGMFARMFGFF